MSPNSEISFAEYQALLIKQEETEQKLALCEAKLSETQEQLQKAHAEAQRSNMLFSAMLDALPLAVQVWSEDVTMLFASQESAKLFQFESTQEFMDNFWKTFPEYQPNGEKSSDFATKLLQETKEKDYLRKNVVHMNTSGEEIPLTATFVLCNLPTEKLRFVFLQDLREHNEFTRKLQESQEYSRIMLDAIPVGSMIWDQNFIPVDCNKAMAKTFGLNDRQEFLQNLPHLYPEFQPEGISSLDKMKASLYRALTDGVATGPWMGRTIDGKEVPTEATAVLVRHNDQNMIVVFYKDLRDVEKSIRKAQAAEKRTQAILEGVPLGINMLTADMQILDCNAEAIRMSGFANKQVYLANVMSYFPENQPCGTPSTLFLQEKFAEVAKSGSSRFECLTYGSEREDIPTDITLTRAYVEEEDLYIGYVADLREAKALLREIELAKDAAEKNAMAKSEFLANMSHEIRTPMNGILGLLHILSATELTELQQDYMEKALFSTKELLRIINDILDFSKIEAGKLDMEVTSFTIHDIVSEIHHLFANAIVQKKLYLKINADDNAQTMLMGDPLRLKQVLINLVGNAIKFTSEGGIQLEITSAVQNDSDILCNFSVKDTGIGLSEDQIDGLFDAFSQADTSVTRKYGGTGLGLAISKRIVELMQGTIWVESTPNIGSTFYFTAYFQVSDSKRESLRAQVDDQHQLDSGPPSGHLLLVEDNAINQIIAEELLKSAGYTLDIANNGQEALDMLELKTYDLVLMDIQMPIMDGLTATKEIRKITKFAHIPIIAMSAHAMSGDREKSIQSGMNEHITKPISPEILYRTLQYWLGKGRMEHGGR